jgi:molecular chaperone DnaK
MQHALRVWTLWFIENGDAAALAYGLDKKRSGTIAVYSLGGGTFDISVLEIGDGVFEVKSTNGDTFLGGEDFDMRLVNYLADEFQKDQGIDLYRDKLALQRLKEAAEKAKIELSSTTQTEVNLPFIAADASRPKHMTMKLTRVKFEALVDDLIQKTAEPCRQALKDAGVSADDVNEVVLVGGMTRMPKVQDAVKQLFGRQLHKCVNPDEAVAVGAAIQAGVLQGDVEDVLLLRRTSLAWGIDASDGCFTPIIDRNTTIPTRKSQVFSTVEDNQTALRFRIFQGNGKRAADNLLVGQLELAGIPMAPCGVPQVEVTFDIDAVGRVCVSARDKATGKEQSVIAHPPGGLSEAELQRIIRETDEQAKQNRRRDVLIVIKNKADALIHSTERALAEHGGEIGDAERRAIENAMADLKEALKSDDAEAIRAKTHALDQTSMKLGEAMYARTQAGSARIDSPAPDRFNTSLHRNPFWLLWASTRDDPQRVVELADEKALVLDADVCQKARADLTNPRARLSAEIAWFPGVSPARAWQIATAVRVVEPLLDAGLPPLPRANILSAAFEVLPIETPTKEITDRILALAKSAEEIDAEAVLRQINEDRSVAKFPPVKDLDVVNQELAERRRSYRNIIKDRLNRLPTKTLVKVINDVADRATDLGKHPAPLVIEDLVDGYETEAQRFIEAEGKNLERLVTKAATAAPEGELAVDPVIDLIWNVAQNWNRVVRPIQLISKTRGIDHLQSRELAFQIRNLSLELYNKHSMLTAAQKITDLLKDSFSALPEFSDRVSDDAAFIEQAVKERHKSAEQLKEWEREITYSVEIGLMFKETLKISPSGIQWGGHLYPLESVSRIRWGGTRHSINGIPTGTSYEIYIGDQRSETVINLRRDEVFGTIIDKLWRAVGVRLLVEHLVRLKNGGRIQFGDATIEDDGVVVQRHAFWSQEPVRLTWHQVQVWSADGSFVIGAKDDRKVYAALPYLRIPNVQVLENMIRALFKTGHSRLSAFLDS